jgi:hypothetical protein
MAVLQQLPKRQQSIFIHKSTTNQSFLNMHYYLKDRGIQNNDFFLALIDPGLAGVDPRDPNLPVNIKARIVQECMHNYWYFLREVVRIPDQGGKVGSGRRYELHRGNLAMNFLFILNFNMFVEMPRQRGKTIAAVCRYLWVYNFGTSNSEIMFMHKDHSGSKGNLKTLKAIRDTLPSYLQFDGTVNNEGKKLKVPNTVVTIQNPYNNNRIETKPGARTKDAANNLGRGATIPLQYYDEFAFMPYNEEIFMAAVPAFSTASENAKRNNAPYGILLTTTPGDLLTSVGQYAYDIRNKCTPWSELYYDFSYQQLLDLRDSNTQSNMFLISYKYQQLGAGQDYFKKIVLEMQSNWPKIRREVMLEWSEISGNCPFTQEELDIIKTYNHEPIQEPILFGKFNQYQLNVYERMEYNPQYPPIIGVDVSGATFGDSSAITIIDSRTTKVIATLNCNYMPADDLAEVIYTIITKYMPNAVCSVERNGGFGAAVVQRLCKTSVKKNLYWEIKDKVIEETFNGVRMEKKPRKVKVYGLDSTKAVRARLIEILQERVRYHKDKFIAPILYDEMRSMEVKKNGKVEHSDRTHDDQVFSYLMALYVWYEGKDLAERYGIRKSTLKTDDAREMEELAFEDELEQGENVDFRSTTFEPNEEIAQELEWIEKDKFVTAKDMQAEQYLNNIVQRDIIMGEANKNLDFDNMPLGVHVRGSKSIMNSGFIDISGSILSLDEDYDDNGNQINNTLYSENGTPLSGNISNFYISL